MGRGSQERGGSWEGSVGKRAMLTGACCVCTEHEGRTCAQLVDRAVLRES